MNQCARCKKEIEIDEIYKIQFGFLLLYTCEDCYKWIVKATRNRGTYKDDE